MTSEKRSKSDALVEILKALTINDPRYYKSDSVDANDAKSDPVSNQKLATHTSDRNKINVKDTSNEDLQQKLLSNRTLLIISVPPTRGHSGSLEVINKRRSTSPSVSSNTQKFDASVDGKLVDDGYSTSILGKVNGRELSHSPSSDIYSCFQMDFMISAVGTEEPNFVYLGLPDVNVSDQFSTFSTSSTRVRRLTYEPYWSASYHVFVEDTAVGMSTTRSEQNYSYKTDFKIGGEISTLGAKYFNELTTFGLDFYWYKDYQRNNITN